MKRIYIFFAFFAIFIGVNSSVNANEIYTSGNFNYYIKDGKAVIESLIDTSVEELKIPATIDGHEVYGFTEAVLNEDGSYNYILDNLSNLKKLTLENVNFKFGVYLNQTDFVKNSTIKEVIVEQKVFDSKSLYELKYFDTSVKFYGYGHTRLQDALQEAGYSYESIGENNQIISYQKVYVKDESGVEVLTEDKNHTEGLNTYVENLVVPEQVSKLELIIRHDYNSSHSVDQFTIDTVATIKTITFETKKAIHIIDQSYFKSLEKVYGYEGTGVENFAKNVGAEFISLGKVDNEINQFNYEIVNNESVAITGLNKTPLYKLEFPAYIEGLPVKVIKTDTIPANSWSKIAEVNDIVIPETVELVEKMAFKGCNLKTLTVYSKNIQYKNGFEFFWAGYGIAYTPVVYAYDESGMKELVSEDRYVSLNNTQYTTVEVQDVTVNNEKISVMPVKKSTDIKDFINETNFPVLNTYTITIYDANGSEKTNTEKIGSKNIIKITNSSGNVLAEYTVIVPGDVTGNGEVKMYDAFTILKDSLFNGKFDELEKLIRDYNNDGKVKMYDAFSFLKQALFN